MAARKPPSPAQETLWRVRAFQFGQVVEPSSGWSFENRERGVAGVVIFQYAVRGKMWYRDARGERDVLPGWAALFALGEASAYGIKPEYAEPFVTNHLSLMGAGLLEHVNLLRARFGSVFHLGEDHPLVEMMRSLADQSRPRTAADAALHASALYAYLLRLYTHLDEQWAREKPPVERAVEELLRHPLHPWSLKEVAVRHGCSREHLTRVFAQRAGAPPAEYLTRAKLRKALELLRETTLPVAAVAEQSGFTNKHTLARWVRGETGRAPGDYRRKGPLALA
ncbi:MAG: hypothetical protein AMXMBFR7_20650 [Planctomycetota bacterium]